MSLRLLRLFYLMTCRRVILAPLDVGGASPSLLCEILCVLCASVVHLFCSPNLCPESGQLEGKGVVGLCSIFLIAFLRRFKKGGRKFFTDRDLFTHCDLSDILSI